MKRERATGIGLNRAQNDACPDRADQRLLSSALSSVWKFIPGLAALS